VIAWLKQQWSRLRRDPTAGTGPTESHRHGSAGENAAAHFLTRERGMTILARNWRRPKDRREELDIVCRSPEGVIVFVEVKTYQTAKLLNGYESVDKRKKAALKRTALAYLRAMVPGWRERSYRLDVIVVERTEDGKFTPHQFENVPLFSKGKHI
jgi:putative endonuclease